MCVIEDLSLVRCYATSLGKFPEFQTVIKPYLQSQAFLLF